MQPHNTHTNVTVASKQDGLTVAAGVCHGQCSRPPPKCPNKQKMVNPYIHHTSHRTIVLVRYPTSLRLLYLGSFLHTDVPYTQAITGLWSRSAYQELPS
jgi:hypothetical protein